MLSAFRCLSVDSRASSTPTPTGALTPMSMLTTEESTEESAEMAEKRILERADEGADDAEDAKDAEDAESAAEMFDEEDSVKTLVPLKSLPNLCYDARRIINNDDIYRRICTFCQTGENYDPVKHEVFCLSCRTIIASLIEKCKCGNNLYVHPSGYVASECKECHKYRVALLKNNAGRASGLASGGARRKGGRWRTESRQKNRPPTGSRR
jgi:hypothetical protein